jgi:type IV secretion system protein VirB10
LDGSSNLASGDRVRACILANRSTTVSQGTLMGAVLETALDSTSPGLARAIVSCDVYGFDGTRVLIPRGSRLIGEYSADTSPGQNRAIINWVRLFRPDGATIALDSPSTDTLGRGGVKAGTSISVFVARSRFWRCRATTMKTNDGIEPNIYLSSFLAPLEPYLARDDVTDI